jgi:hypothetical protein
MLKTTAGLGRKLMIVIWFGPYPEWLDQWVANMEYLKKYGYDYMIVSSKPLFEQRVREKLGIEPNIIAQSGKPWDFRPALGILFEEELKGYEFWGHTDFDCVYGDISKFEPDLSTIDIWSNHFNYICGPWCLYRNCDKVNNLFHKSPVWEIMMTEQQANGWVEMEYSHLVDRLHEEGYINRKYTHYQSRDPQYDDLINFKDGKLFEGDTEVMTFHFNRHKRIPPMIKRYDI